VSRLLRQAAPCVAQECAHRATGALTAGTAAPPTHLSVGATAVPSPMCASRTNVLHQAASLVAAASAQGGRSVPRAMCAAQLTGRCVGAAAVSWARCVCWGPVPQRGQGSVARSSVTQHRPAWTGYAVLWERQPAGAAAAPAATRACRVSSVHPLAAACAATARSAMRRSSVLAGCCAVTRGPASVAAPAAPQAVSARLAGACSPVSSCVAPLSVAQHRPVRAAMCAATKEPPSATMPVARQATSV